MFGPGRRMARRTARRTTRRQLLMRDMMSPEPYYDEPQYEPPPQQAASARPDYAGELEQLARLREQGIVTDEEFEAKKKQILGL